MVAFLGAALLLAVLAGRAGAAVSPLADAAERNDTTAVRELLRGGADANDAQGDGMTALHWAAEHGNLELARMLLVAGANANAGTRLGGYTPLHLASRNGHPDIVAALLAARAKVDAATTNSGTLAIHLAAGSPDPRTVAVLLDAGADPNARERAWQQTPLTFAAAANRAEAIRLLLAAGADPSLTALVVDTAEWEKADKAAETRLDALLEELKEKAGGGSGWKPGPAEVQGAIGFSREILSRWPDVPDPDCDTRDEEDGARVSPDGAADKCAAADGAAAEEEEEEEEEPSRMSYGEKVGQWGGLTPLLHAVRQGHEEAAFALLDGGADINQPSAGDRTTPLLMAAVNGQFDLALRLLERGADPNLLSEAGAGPLIAVLERRWAPWAHWAHPVDYQDQQTTYLEMLQALLDAGADPNVRLEKHLWFAEFTTSVLVPAGLHYDGATPFWRAAQALDVDAMKLLVAHGADPNIPTRKIPARRSRSPEPKDVAADEADPTGLPPVPIGGPFVYPVHAASGAGYGQYFMAHAHRHVPDNWLRAVRYLVEECGADVNLRDANGYTPLHHAAARGDNELILYLIEKGADVKAVARSGQTTADMANGPTQRVTPFPATIDLLVGLGAVNNHNCVSC